eukprot:5218839-Prorocentrum_lima.AAC.1
MQQPVDGIIGDDGLEGLKPGQLLEVIGSVYGLVDSPRKWYISFRTRMEKMGWETHSLDVA